MNISALPALEQPVAMSNSTVQSEVGGLACEGRIIGMIIVVVLK